jgi:hypothetical protein
MNESTIQQIAALLADPDKLLATRPYYRVITNVKSPQMLSSEVESVGTKVRATLPRVRRRIVPIGQLLKEYDPWSHTVLHDENIPSITVKNSNGGWIQIESKRMPIPFQQNITKKQTLHLCNNQMSHVLLNTEPTDAQNKQFIKIKQTWDERNMDGIKTEAVLTQKSESVVGMLFYHDFNGEIKARILKYSDGFNIITHKDANGDHILECVYYSVDDVEYIDCYDDTYMYRITSSDEVVTDEKGVMTSDGWVHHTPVPHGFSECPLAVKRGPVAWDNVQDLIEVYERTYNTFMVIQNRYGWGVLYVKGKFNQTGQKVAGNVVLNDTSMSPEADAKILTPPSPQNMIETLDQMEYSIQKGSGTTFILPKDIKLSGDTSGIAVQLTQELDIETALQDVNEWQNFANKMMRLFKEGLARELVVKGEEGFEKAITDFKKLNIRTRFVVWRPQSNEAYNQMLTTLSGAGAISKQTLIEKNTESCPDELSRVAKEKDAEMQEELDKQEKTLQLTKKYSEKETTVVND